MYCGKYILDVFNLDMKTGILNNQKKIQGNNLWLGRVEKKTPKKAYLKTEKMPDAGGSSLWS
jgi:hypothetical protein